MLQRGFSKENEYSTFFAYPFTLSPLRNLKALLLFCIISYHWKRAQSTDDIIKPVVTKFPSVDKTSDHFGISIRADTAIVSAAFQDTDIISQCNVFNVVDRNKIWHERTNSRTILSSQAVVKDYNDDQFGLHFDGRKDRIISQKNNNNKNNKKCHNRKTQTR